MLHRSWASCGAFGPAAMPSRSSVTRPSLVRSKKRAPSTSPGPPHPTYIRELIGKPAPLWAADTLAALQSWRADMLVTDSTLPATIIAAEKLGLPVASLVPNIWMLPTAGIPPLGPGWAPARGPSGRVRDALMRAITTWVFASATPWVNAPRAAHADPRRGLAARHPLRPWHCHAWPRRGRANRVHADGARSERYSRARRASWRRPPPEALRVVQSHRRHRPARPRRASLPRGCSALARRHRVA